MPQKGYAKTITFSRFIEDTNNKTEMKKHIAIIAGGDSSEHEVSLRSAAGIYSFLDKERYEVHIVRIRGKQWEVDRKSVV